MSEQIYNQNINSKTGQTYNNANNPNYVSSNISQQQDNINNKSVPIGDIISLAIRETLHSRSIIEREERDRERGSVIYRIIISPTLWLIILDILLLLIVI